MEGGGATTDRKRKAEEGVLKPAAEDDDGVQQIDVVEGSKHSDGSIYRADAHPLHELFHLADTRETRLKPMRLTNPTPSCELLPLLDGVPAAPGLRHAADLLPQARQTPVHSTSRRPWPRPPLRVHRRPRPPGPSAQLCVTTASAREGEEEEGDDLPLIDGAATVSELEWTQAALTSRIPGELGAAVDLRRSLLHRAVEATVEVRITRLAEGPPPRTRAVELEITGCLAGKLVEEEIKLFRGVVRQPCALERFVVAARSDSYLFLHFKGAGAAKPPEEFDWFAFRVTSHGCASDRRKFGLATVEVKVTWSSLC
ncbi:unnamed protein product [Urochloa decumbens]|uniref:DUF6598 domain-containing protein n=1 Tax=Urochloa decumbens TaxID=240449 RepID=A0ABC8VJS9_9POAL